MKRNNPQISVIVPTFNRADYLIDTLTSIIQNNITPVAFELIVVDNNSKDNTAQAVDKFISQHPEHNIRYTVETQQGASHARNRGIQEANSPLMLFIDDDEIVTPNIIQKWLSFFEDHPKAIGGGGQIKVRFEDPRPEWMSHFLMPLLGEHKISDSVKRYPPSKFPFAGNMAYRTDVFDQYGLLKTDLGRRGTELLAGEEKEFYYRLRNHTDQIYHVPDAVAYHRVYNSRMTKDFIKKQALGLGKSMHMQLASGSVIYRLKYYITECLKLIASVPLALFYTVTLQPAKGIMLFRFRKWIWEGYTTNNSPQISKD
jgi:glycosyltransferase involved in cell wall biosynthesis